MLHEGAGDMRGSALFRKKRITSSTASVEKYTTPQRSNAWEGSASGKENISWILAAGSAKVARDRRKRMIVMTVVGYCRTALFTRYFETKLTTKYEGIKKFCELQPMMSAKDA